MAIWSLFGIDYRRTLAQVIAANTDIPTRELSPNVFLTPPGAATQASADGTQRRR